MVFSFPPDFASTDPNFTTLFRLLDDFDTYSREVSGSGSQDDSSHPRHYPTRIQHGSFGGGGGRWGRNRRGVNPRFDIRETRDAYELYGEVPGAEREDIHVELTEPNTLLVYGRVERDYGPAPGGEEEKEDDGGEKEKGKEKAEGEGEGSNEAEGEKKGGKKGGKSKEDPSVRFFLRERHFGEFAREFAFPGTLQEFDIEATLEKGVLKVVAPKQQPAKGRKIEIK